MTGVAELPGGTEMVMPGDNVELVIELITPVAMEKGLRFAIREGRPHRVRGHHQRELTFGRSYWLFASNC